MTTKAFVLLTAMPPTTGHLQLVQFAAMLDGHNGNVNVLLNTQPDEPFPFERRDALRSAFDRCGLAHVRLAHLHETQEQDPSAPGFWPMWRGIMKSIGMKPGDYIVASEPYGKRLAAETGGVFFPYDVDRSINAAKATEIRRSPLFYFDRILPEFRSYLRTTVTVFGAESCGKTTLSRALANRLDSPWLFEYARPYLEQTENRIDVDSMSNIWMGQAALQRHGQRSFDRPFVIQDTDLFTTYGYWNLCEHSQGSLPTWSGLGAPPQRLVSEAVALKSDLYLVVKSNIPFEEDPLRYGSGQREGDDAYWLDICDQFGLPLHVIEAADPLAREFEACEAIFDCAAKKLGGLWYDRGGF